MCCGGSTGRLIAEASARKELAKVFKVKVSSQTTVTSRMSSKTDKDQVLSGETEEEMNQKLQETSEEVLEGVVTKEVYDDGESYYALVSLDKGKASQILRSKMETLDELLKEAVKTEKALLGQALELLKLREGLHQRYEFLKARN